MQIIASELISAAGPGKESLWAALKIGRDCSQPSNQVSWSSTVPFNGRLCLIHDDLHVRVRWKKTLAELWRSIQRQLKSTNLKLMKNSKVGLIFSSTKGMIEDLFPIDQTHKDLNLNDDPYWPIIEDFQQENLDFPMSRISCVSHACASTHVSLEQADFWLRNEICDFVILIAGDYIGPFVSQGFQSLKIITNTTCQPFASNRDGLQLGEACAIMLLGGEKHSRISDLKISAISSESEGVSVTRPSMDGSSLFQAIQKLNMQKNPDLIIAHGTGTKFNDFSEDQAFQKLKVETPITGCKWSIGHTLGASGAIDIIAASEALRSQTVFALANTKEKDPQLHGNYLLAGQKNLPNKLSSILVTSLGFGGIHGALVLEKE